MIVVRIGAARIVERSHGASAIGKPIADRTKREPCRGEIRRHLAMGETKYRKELDAVVRMCLDGKATIPAGVSARDRRKRQTMDLFRS